MVGAIFCQQLSFYSEDRIRLKLLTCRWEKQKRRLTGFMDKIKLKDAASRHLILMKDEDLENMSKSFYKVEAVTYNQEFSSSEDAVLTS